MIWVWRERFLAGYATLCWIGLGELTLIYGVRGRSIRHFQGALLDAEDRVSTPVSHHRQVKSAPCRPGCTLKTNHRDGFMVFRLGCRQDGASDQTIPLHRTASDCILVCHGRLSYPPVLKHGRVCDLGSQCCGPRDDYSGP